MRPPVVPSIGIAFLALGLAACGSVDSRHPLVDPAATEADDALVGYWRWESDATPPEEPVAPVLVVGRPAAKPGTEGRPAGLLDVCAVALKADGTLEVLRGALAGTTVGGRRYLDVQDPEKPDGHWFVRYDLESPDRLRLHVPKVAFFARAVLEGRLEGSVDGVTGTGEGVTEEDLAQRSVHLTASTAQLRAFVEAHAERAFEPAGKPLVRLPRSTAGPTGESGPR